MEWGTVTTLVAEVLFGGGLLVFVTIKDKKTAAILDNMQRVIEEERGLADEYKKEIISLKEEAAKREEHIRSAVEIELVISHRLQFLQSIVGIAFSLASDLDVRNLDPSLVFFVLRESSRSHLQTDLRIVIRRNHLMRRNLCRDNKKLVRLHGAEKSIRGAYMSLMNRIECTAENTDLHDHFAFL